MSTERGPGFLTISVTLRARGAAAVDEVWDRYARPTRWSEWAPQIHRVETGAATLARGASGRVWGPLGLHVDFIVDDVDEPHRSWSWRVRLGPIRLAIQHTVEAADDGAATSLHITGAAPVVLAYTPLAQFALNRLVKI